MNNDDFMVKNYHYIYLVFKQGCQILKSLNIPKRETEVRI